LFFVLYSLMILVISKCDHNSRVNRLIYNVVNSPKIPLSVIVHVYITYTPHVYHAPPLYYMLYTSRIDTQDAGDSLMLNYFQYSSSVLNYYGVI